MYISDYVANQDELNSKVQEYSLLNYKMDVMSQDFAILKKRNIGRTATIVLIILAIIFFPLGTAIVLLYYYTREMYEVHVEISPERAGETVPYIPNPEIMPLKTNSQTTTQNTNMNNNNDNVVSEEYSVKEDPVVGEVASSNNVVSEAEPVNNDNFSTGNVNNNMNQYQLLSQKKSVGIAVLLSFFIPGLGFLYIKEMEQFFVYFLSYFVILIINLTIVPMFDLGILSLIISIVLFVLWLVQLIRTYQTVSEKNNNIMMKIMQQG